MDQWERKIEHNGILFGFKKKWNLSFDTTLKDLEDLVLSGVSCSQMEQHCTFPPVSGI